jgi:hypothetical protein
MKTTILYSLVLLTMLGIGLSCKKVIEEVTPPVVTKPGSSTTPTSTTPVATTPTADTAWLAAYPPGCRIVKTVYKGYFNSTSQRIDPEIITLDDGRKVEVSLFSTDYNKYDAQGRIFEIRTEYGNGRKFLDPFNYSNNMLIVKRNFLTYTDTLILNAAGFIKLKSPNSTREIQYNQDGQVINKYASPGPELANRYENGNLIWEADIQRSDYIADQTVTYKYDLTHANLPVIYQYYGKSSRNLPIEALRNACCDFGGALVYRKTFTYTFDERGRVKRRVTHGTGYNQWLITDDPGGIGVTDYEYECP